MKWGRVQADRGGELARIERLPSDGAADVVVPHLVHLPGVLGQLVGWGGAREDRLVLHPLQLVLEGHLVGGYQQWVGPIL